MFHTLRLNLSLKPSLETSLFRSNSSWGSSGQFHEKIRELTLTQDCIPQTAEVITKRATKMAHMHAYERNILLTWQISALTAILQLYNSSRGTFSYSFILFFSQILFVSNDRLLYIAFQSSICMCKGEGWGGEQHLFFELV